MRIEGPGRVERIETDEPLPGPGEVLVHVSSAALCATDRRLATVGTTVPRIPGHEVAGLLEDGTAVGVQPNVGCGRCGSCAQGLGNRCPDHVDIGIQRDGGLAEWLVVPLDGFPLDLAPSIEPLACCLHAVAMLDVGPDELAVVVGAGTLGIIGMWALQAAGARVAVVQRSEARRAELGADAVLEPGANLVHYRHLRLVGSTGSTVADHRRVRDLARARAIALDRLPSRTITLDEVPGVLLDPRPDPRTLRFVATP